MATGTLRAWYRDSDESRPEELHQETPGQVLSAEEVYRLSGVKCVWVDNCQDSEVQRQLAEGYAAHDSIVISPEAMGDAFKARTAVFADEHLHEDPEIRMVTAGSGFFEIRTFQDRWVRLHLRQGDLVHLPPGIYHRLKLDKGQDVTFFRLYSEVPKWEAFYRPEADAHPARARYLQTRDKMADKMADNMAAQGKIMESRAPVAAV